jgi:hypothetical protein
VLYARSSPSSSPFQAANYTKWVIYMCASLGRAGLLGHIDNNTIADATNATWATADYIVINIMHATIDANVVDLVLASN